MSLAYRCIIVAALLCAWVDAMLPAHASDVVHKCRDGNGQAYYQAVPCPATQRTEWMRAYPVAEAAPAPPAAAVPATQTRSSTDRKRVPRRAGSRRGGAGQGAVISMHRDPVACEKAKAARDRAYARLGLRRDFDTSRRLDDRVRDACR